MVEHMLFWIHNICNGLSGFAFALSLFFLGAFLHILTVTLT